MLLVPTATQDWVWVKTLNIRTDAETLEITALLITSAVGFTLCEELSHMLKMISTPAHTLTLTDESRDLTFKTSAVISTLEAMHTYTHTHACTNTHGFPHQVCLVFAVDTDG